MLRGGRRAAVVMAKAISFAYVMFLGAILSAADAESSLFDRISDGNDFTGNILSKRITETASGKEGVFRFHDSITITNDFAIDTRDRSIIIVGSIHVVDAEANTQSFASDEVGDKLGGGSDIFICSVSSKGSMKWSRRLGSRKADTARAVVVDGDGNIYVAAKVGRMAGNPAGAALMMYNSTGSRVWLQTYGTTEDSFNEVALSGKNEIVVTGSIGRNSPIHTTTTNRTSPSVLVMRVDSLTGYVLSMTAPESFPSATGAVGYQVFMTEINSTTNVFVVGSTSYSEGQRKAAIYALSYPDLLLKAKSEVKSSPTSQFKALALSNNKFSVYAAGEVYVDNYSNEDAFVGRFSTSNLDAGWSAQVSSAKADSIANAQTGKFSEISADMSVDQWGNIYVLLKSSGALGPEPGQSNLDQARPAVLVFSPNGSLLHTVQSTSSEQVIPKRMVIVDDYILVVGSVQNSTTNLEHIFVGGVGVPSNIRKINSAELEGNSGSRETDFVLFPGKGSEAVSTSNIAPLVASGAAVGALVVITVLIGIFVVLRRRKSLNAPRDGIV